MSSSTTEAQGLVDVVMPQMGVSVSEGTIVGWTRQLGDAVERDETICEVSTDKVDTECPAPVAGTLVEILVDAGETVETGTVLGRIGTDAAVEAAGGDAPDATGSAADEAGGLPEPGDGTDRRPVPAVAHVPPGDGPRRHSPVARRMAAAHGIDLDTLTGSGRNGRVTKKDVEAGIAARAASEAEPALHSDSPYRPDAPAADARPAAASSQDPAAVGGTATELSRMRRSIGAAMRNSLDTAATCTTVVECDMTRVETRRRELGLTALPLVARHAIDALHDFPDLNATLDGDSYVRYEPVHLGIAVSLRDEGLIVPVIHDAQQLAPEGLGDRIRDLADRARGGRLAPDDVQGGTFTITSPGAFGALMATPIINVPQVAILDLEAIVRRPVVVVDEHGGESIAIRSMAYLCLSWDHRAIDGAYAARFLTALRQRIEAA